jgi:hypothetical protein
MGATLPAPVTTASHYSGTQAHPAEPPPFARGQTVAADAAHRNGRLHERRSRRIAEGIRRFIAANRESTAAGSQASVVGKARCRTQGVTTRAVAARYDTTSLARGPAMKTLLVGYDLNSPGQDYTDLTEHLKTYENWWHHLDSTWVIRTSRSTTEVRDAIRQHLDANDELLVVELTGVGAWAGFNAKGSQWLLDNL